MTFSDKQLSHTRSEPTSDGGDFHEFLLIQSISGDARTSPEREKLIERPSALSPCIVPPSLCLVVFTNWKLLDATAPPSPSA